MPAALYCVQVDHNSPLPTRSTESLAFVTLGTYASGGGIQAFDSACAAEATDAGLDGDFVALVATAASGAASRSGSTTWTRLDPVAWSPRDVYSPPLQVTAQGKRLVRIDAGWPAQDNLIPGDLRVWVGAEDVDGLGFDELSELVVHSPRGRCLDRDGRHHPVGTGQSEL